jgi:hypothetical protein
VLSPGSSVISGYKLGRRATQFNWDEFHLS